MLFGGLKNGGEVTINVNDDNEFILDVTAQEVVRKHLIPQNYFTIHTSIDWLYNTILVLFMTKISKCKNSIR